MKNQRGNYESHKTFLIIFLIPCQESIAQNVPQRLYFLFDGKTLKVGSAADMSWWSVGERS